MNQQQIELIRQMIEDNGAHTERGKALVAMLRLVEKLPVTANGVVVVPGMELHNRSGSVAGTACMALDDGDYYSPHFRDDYDDYFAPEATRAAANGGG